VFRQTIPDLQSTAEIASRLPPGRAGFSDSAPGPQKRRHNEADDRESGFINPFPSVRTYPRLPSRPARIISSLALIPGTRLGDYEVTAQIGEGGMGQVYRARDTKLNRDVALKMLPDAFASDPDRLARFTREAQTLASLNHPNIAAIYGIEESKDVRALVMELVAGEDLSQRLARGAIPIDEALQIANRSQMRSKGRTIRGSSTAI
jgi:serine/threonine protein kinase